MDSPKSKIVIFLLLTAIFSAAAMTPIIRAGDVNYGGGVYVFATMWSPGVAAILTRFITQRNLRGMGWTPRAPRFLLLAYLLPLAYALPVYIIAWATGLGSFEPTKWVVQPGLTPVTGLLLIATAGALVNVLAAAGEEIGWRGLLVPELAKITSFRKVAIISGLIWAAWHMPGVIGTDYQGKGTPIIYSVVCFALMIVALSFIMAWITMKSGSVWPAVLLHASHNLFVQAVFDSATIESAYTNWWTSEFGAGLVVTITIAAFALLRFAPVRTG